MPDEYRLKYSGEKIDTLLEKIDGVGMGSKETAGLLKLTDNLNDSQGGLAVTPQAVKSAVASATEEITGKIKDQFKTVTATFTVDGWTKKTASTRRVRLSPTVRHLRLKTFFHR